MPPHDLPVDCPACGGPLTTDPDTHPDLVQQTCDDCGHFVRSKP